MSVNGFEVLSRTFVTGETPLQAYGIFGGRPDFDSRDMWLLWDGCLDAPEFIASGKLVVNMSENSIVPAYVVRP
jgi:hypothetical protein